MGRGQYIVPWDDRTTTEKKVMLEIAAKKNLKMRAWLENTDERPNAQLPEFLQGANFKSQVWNDMSEDELGRWLHNMSRIPDDDGAEEQIDVAEKAVDDSATATGMEGPAYMRIDWGWMPDFSKTPFRVSG